MSDSPLSPEDIDYLTGHYSGLLAYAIAQRIGWPVVYYSIPGEKRWRAASVESPTGVEFDARGAVERENDYGRRIASAAQMELLRSYYEQTTVRARIDAAADAMCQFLEPGFGQ